MITLPYEHPCPNCKSNGQIFNKHGYFSFQCKCGVEVTSPNRVDLKRRLSDVARARLRRDIIRRLPIVGQEAQW